VELTNSLEEVLRKYLIQLYLKKLEEILTRAVKED